MTGEQTNSVGENAHAYQVEALELEEEMEKELKGEHVYYYYVHDLVNRVKKTDQVVYTLRSGKPFPHFDVVQQQLAKVLSWKSDTDSFPLRSGVRLPVFKAQGARSDKLQQLWIARHRPLLVR